MATRIRILAGCFALGGPFDQATGHYVDNIIVYAHLIA